MVEKSSFAFARMMNAVGRLVLEPESSALILPSLPMK